ncbi:hypothetical protein H4R34_000449 [Dimargaris verticillata]|uniref:THIF-type NAD/FAD binding fold domain-containing protein n=1 Tax=Dimargaris verticillata TaxID=2761393 RepID=A0A9W8B6M8_9FUNG|nr:hypothetical protein H4R34_000449 [Dimargaris verticillata]
MLDWLKTALPALTGSASSPAVSHHRAQLVATAAAASALTAGVILGVQSHRRHRHAQKLKDELAKRRRDSTASQPYEEATIPSSLLTAEGLPQLGAGSTGTATAHVVDAMGPVDAPEFIIREQLSRNTAFLGEDGMQRLRGAYVVVVGAGGVGSWATTMLARTGVENIRVIDFDQVTLSSLNRHSVATRRDVGIPKVVALQHRLAEIVPHVCIDAQVELFRLENAQALLLELPEWLNGTPNGPRRPDFILDCIDNIDTKIELLQFCHAHHLPVISSMGAGAKADPSRVQISDISHTYEDPLARSVRRALRKANVVSGIPVVYSTEKPSHVKLLPLAESQANEADEYAILPDFRSRILPVLGTLPAIFGMVMATYVICQLAQFPIEPLAIKQRDALYQRLHRDLCNRHGVYYDQGNKNIPLSQDDVGYLFEEVWRGRSALSGTFEKPTLVRWRSDQPLSMQNCVCMTKKEAKEHDALTEPVELHYSPEVLQYIASRLAEEKRLSQWR